MKYFFLLLLFLLLVSCMQQQEVVLGGKTVSIELARTAQERSEGLMYRESLCEDCGMLFVFDEEKRHSFWMKNTLLVLDMVFISANLTVVDVVHAVPCERDPCQVYTPSYPALYVLEVANGTFDERVVGEKIQFILIS